MDLVFVLGVIHSSFSKSPSWLPNDPISVNAILGLGKNHESFGVKVDIIAGKEVVTKGAFRVDATAQLLNKNSLMNEQ